MKIMVLNMHKCEKVVALSLVSFSLIFIFIFLVGSLASFFILVGFFGLFYFLTWDNAPLMMIITLSTQNLEQL